MIYTDKFGNEFELPKYTLDLSEKFKSAATETGRNGYLRRYELLKDILPEEYINEALDGATIDEIDITQLQVLFSAVRNAYEGPAIAEQLQSAQELMDKLGPMYEQIAKIQANSGSKPSRQVFNRVK